MGIMRAIVAATMVLAPAVAFGQAQYDAKKVIEHFKKPVAAKAKGLA